MNHYRAAIKELRTVRDLLRFAITRFHEAQLHYGHGTNNAHDEAAYLILHTLHLPLDALTPYLDARLTQTEREAVVQILERRVKEKIPAAYITREAWLQNYAFYVDERVIVPRSYIAELLTDGLAPWVQDPNQALHLLELCTGSGCLSIIAADVFPHAQIIAADISPDALAVARTNVENYQLQDRIRLLASDLFEKIPKKKYDLILVNPPYVPTASMQTLPAEYRAEPELALAGGAQGLDLIHRLLSQADDYLKKNGLLLVEVGHERPALEAAYPHLPLTWLSTSAGDDRVFMLRKSGGIQRAASELKSRIESH